MEGENNTNQENQTPTEETKSPKNLWAWIVLIGIVVAIVFGFYYWPNIKPAEAPVNTEEFNQPDAATQALEQATTSDEVADIEQDLNATDLSDLDRELSDIETELNQP
ncbi:MAG: hypothetical protein AAB642_01245 [Patescibacteria group bacterium]